MICRGRKTQLVVSNQVVTNPCYGLVVIFFSFISLLIGRETINIPEVFSGLYSFTGKTVNCLTMKVVDYEGIIDLFVTKFSTKYKLNYHLFYLFNSGNT